MCWAVAPCRAVSPCCSENRRPTGDFLQERTFTEPLPEPQPVLPRRPFGCDCGAGEAPGVFCLPEDKKCCCNGIPPSSGSKLLVQDNSLSSSFNSRRRSSAESSGDQSPEFGAFHKGDQARDNSRPLSSSHSARSHSTREDRSRRAANSRSDQQALSRSSHRRGVLRNKAVDDDEEDDSDEDDTLNKYYVQELHHEDYDHCLLVACYLGDEKKARVCLEHDALPTMEDSKGFRAGFHAAMSGDLKCLRTLLEFDVHANYNQYFDCSVTIDKMTPLMTIIRHGLTEIYEFLVLEYGCIVRLLGDRFARGVSRRIAPGNSCNGSGRDGTGVPLDRWLALLPELSHPSHISKRRPLELGYRRILPNHKITDKEFLYLQEQRSRARNFLRKVVHNQLYQDDDKSDRSARVTSKSRRMHKRNAIIGDEATEEWLKLLTSYDTVGQFVTDERLSARSSRSQRSARQSASAHHRASQSPRAEGSDLAASPRLASPRVSARDGLVWECGLCKQVQRLKGVETRGCNVPCKHCAKVNFLEMPRKHTKRDDDEESQHSDDGEHWVNAGAEFLEEDIVEKYMNIFRRSCFWHLGQQRLRELIRVVKYSEVAPETIIFSEGFPLDALYVLKGGWVAMQSTIDVAQDGHTIHVDQVSENHKHHPPVLPLDYRSFMGSRQAFLSTCKSKSEKVQLFKFRRSDVEEHCGDETLKKIILDSQSHAVLSTTPVFRVAFDERESLSIGPQLVYREFVEGEVLVRSGQRLGYIMIVQRGVLRIQDTTTLSVKKVFVSPEKTNASGAGESYMSVFALGVRLLLYDLTAPSTVEVDSKNAEIWVMDVKQCDQVLTQNGNLLNHLQIATYILYLLRVPMFKRLKHCDPRLRTLVMRSHTMEYWHEEEILRQGDPGDSLYILVEGTVSVTVFGNQVAQLTADIDHDKVHYFGEIALLVEQPRSATIKVMSTSATALRVGIEAIDAGFVSLDELLAEQGISKDDLVNQAKKDSKDKQDKLQRKSTKKSVVDAG